MCLGSPAWPPFRSNPSDMFSTKIAGGGHEHGRGMPPPVGSAFPLPVKIEVSRPRAAKKIGGNSGGNAGGNILKYISKSVNYIYSSAVFFAFQGSEQRAFAPAPFFGPAGSPPKTPWGVFYRARPAPRAAQKSLRGPILARSCFREGRAAFILPAKSVTFALLTANMRRRAAFFRPFPAPLHIF